MTSRHYTESEDTLVRTLYPVTPTPKLAAQLGRTPASVYQRARMLGLLKDKQYMSEHHGARCRDVGKTARFKPGQVSWNKGLTYQPGGRCKETQFVPGRKPHTWKPVGSYGVMDGYLRVKVTDIHGSAEDWRYVHHLAWEAVHGPIPKGMAVVFRSGVPITDPGQVTADQLELLTRAELVRRNSVHRHGPELARLSQLKGVLQRQINRRTREQEEA